MDSNKKGYYRGVFFLLMMMVVGCGNDIIVKFIGQRLDALQVIFSRFFFGLITLLPFAVPHGVQIFKTTQLTFNVIRGVLGAASIFLFTYSVMRIPLVEVVAIMWTIPLFTLILSIFFLGEKVSTLCWIATILGFVGLSFITLYDSDATVALKWLYAVPIAAAFLFAVQDVMIKKIVDNENRITMFLYFSFVTSVLSFVPALLVWKSPTLFEYSMLLLLGIGGNLIQYFIFKAFSAADLSALSPFRYVEFLFSAAFAFIFFAEIPGINVLIGALILIPSTLYLVYNESKERRCQAA